MFRIRTLMIAVAVVAMLVFVFGLFSDLSWYDWVIDIGCGMIVLLMLSPVAAFLVFGLLITPSDPPPRE